MRRFDEERRTYEGSDEWYRDRDRDRDRGGWWSGGRDEERSEGRERGRGRSQEYGRGEGYGGPYGGGGYPGYGRDYGRGQSSMSREGFGERDHDYGERGYGGRGSGGRDREREAWGGREGGREIYQEERYAPDRDFWRGDRGDEDYRGRGGYGGGRGRELGEDDYGAWGTRQQGRDQEGRQSREGWRGSERGPHTGRGPRSFKRSDDRIRDGVNERLEDDDWLDASDIEVHSQDGVVTLEGKVTSKEAKRRAEDIAESSRGVKDVMNRLRVEQEEGILERIGNALPD